MRVPTLLVTSLGAAQLLDLPPISAAGFTFSIDEAVLTVGVIVAALHYGARIHPSRLLVLLALSEVAAQSTSSAIWLDLSLVPILRSSILLFAYLLFLDFYRANSFETIRVWSRTWLIVGIISAVVVLVQVAGIVPALSFNGGTMVIRDRPTGLQGDANMAALSLGMALIPIQHTRYTTRMKLAAFLVISLAIVGTLSRMGLVILAIVSLLHWYRLGQRHRLSVVLLVGGLTSVGIATSGYVAFHSLGAPAARFSELSATVETVRSGDLLSNRGVRRDSAEERAVVAMAAMEVWRQHPVLGVGPEALEHEIGDRTGIYKAGHNGYLDRLAIGGIFGAGSLLILLRTGQKSWRLWRATSGRENGAHCGLRELDIRLSVEIFVVSLVAQMFLNVSLWISVGLSVAVLTVASRTAQEHPRRSESMSRSHPKLGYERP